MKKLLAFVDNYIVKIGVILTFAFIALYPKLPTIHIIRTWVYIRLEDFSIALITAIWLIQLLRRKVKLPLPVGIPIGIYWLVGLLSTVFCLLFIGPHLVGFFPHLAILEYGRRIEYMILFFVAFSTVGTWKDIRDYAIVVCLTLLSVVIYGFGQEFYLTLWGLFPKFFEQYSFCFPSFQTGNEQFAKGIALCLPTGARITSTFGGHYDLAAYLVVVLPLLLGIFIAVKKLWVKIGISVLFILSLMLLVFTASRVSFIAYLVGACCTLLFMKQKKLLLPVLVVSIACLLLFSSSTAKRFLETFRVVNVITNNQGQVVGLAENNLPTSLKNKISKNDSVVVSAPPPTQNLPTGSSFITLSQTAVATSNAYIKQAIPTTEAQKLQLAAGGFEISTVSGNFLIQKAIVYDISFTTRFQAEWPSAWAAFTSSPILGKGYSTITLATDNDYLRLLGETGVLGFAAFFLIFIVFGIFLMESIPTAETNLTLAFAIGLAGGVIGLFLNATLIDVFEASKVAESLWILLGIAVGGLSLGFTKQVDYVGKIKKILSSHIFLILLLGILAFFVFGGGLSNFFVADDFTWLKWAATAHPSDMLTYFVNAQGSIYRPIPKILMIVFYSLFSFQPTGYHVVGIFVHLLIAIGLYMLGLLFFKKKLWAFLLAGIYLVLPIQAEVLFWISTISISFATLFMVYSVLTYVYFRKKQAKIFYIFSLVLGLISLFTFEMAVVLPLLLILTDVLLIERKLTKKIILLSIPYFFFDAFYLLVRSHANVAMGGDYSYSITHFIPNIIANFGNYILATFLGERVVAWQYGLRQVLKTHTLPVTLLLLVGVGGIAAFVVMVWKKLDKEFMRNLAFGFLFAATSLLPFLDLGNISERYGYLAAVGFAYVVVVLIQYVWHFWQNKKAFQVSGVVVGLVFLFFANWLISSELQEWVKAGMITYNALAYFRIVKPDLSSGATLYVSHLPTKYGNAWIFPVGLIDGLWFIYRDDTLQIVKTDSVDESLALKHAKPTAILNKSYVFDFDKNGQMFEY